MSQTKIDISNLSDAVIAALSVPKITSITYPGDDTAANPTGGQEIILTGSGFGTGAIVNVAGVPVSVSSVVNNNTISFTSPAKATGTYSLSVINTDGGIATSISNIEYSGVPAWSTAAGTLGTLYETSFINAQLTAVSDSPITYTVTAGALPVGATLNSTTGILIGTAASVASSTTYSFTVDAVDAEQQNTSRNFSATINPDVVSWSSPANGVSYTGNEGDVFTQALSATSAAGKTISYSANALPTGLSITGSTLAGTFSAATTSASLITATAAVTNKTATRTLNWSIASAFSPIPIAYLLVAGAGGNPLGGGKGGGGGGGGVVRGDVVVNDRTINVVVGAGGAPGTGASSSVSTSGGNGGASYITSAGISYTIQANGGGGGGGPNRGGGLAGGSGGGGGITGQAGGASNKLTIVNATSYGNPGGSGGGDGWHQGGGGGAGGVAGNGYFGSGPGGTAGQGGAGITIDMGGGITGTYGAGHTGNPANGETGIAGLVILRTSDTVLATSTTGNPTITVAGGYRIYQFTSSGSITF